ncbi:MAG: hypothetical protein AAF687_02595 [Pseudomonadota bacterium]
MSRAIALTRHASQQAVALQADLARAAIVLGSSAALILAGQPLPL